jgi:hypothetical protein
MASELKAHWCISHTTESRILSVIKIGRKVEALHIVRRIYEGVSKVRGPLFLFVLLSETDFKY